MNGSGSLVKDTSSAGGPISMSIVSRGVDGKMSYRQASWPLSPYMSRSWLEAEHTKRPLDLAEGVSNGP